MLSASCQHGAVAPVLAERAGRSNQLALVDVSVGSMMDERIARHQTILVNEGTIVRIGDKQQVAVPAEATVVDGHGQFLVLPGLIDAHTHAEELLDLAAFAVKGGVTTILNMGQLPSSPAMLRRKEIESGAVLGPRVFAGFFIDGAAGFVGITRTPEESRAAVRSASDAGYDFIKIYSSLSADQFEAVVAEARLHKLAVVGHIARAEGFERSVRGGQVMVAHAEEYVYTYFDNRSDAARIPSAVAVTRDAGATVTANASAFEAIDAQWGRPARLAELLAKPEAAFLSRTIEQRWRSSDYVRRAGSLGDRLGFIRTLIRSLHDGGVPILAGTDAPAVPGMFPGVSIHDELRNLTQSGLTPFEALVAATRAPGEFLKRFVPAAGVVGVVVEGARADLLVVAADSLGSLESLRAPAGLVLNGRWRNQRELNAALDSLRTLDLARKP